MMVKLLWGVLALASRGFAAMAVCDNVMDISKIHLFVTPCSD